jgi:hypothetical protein
MIQFSKTDLKPNNLFNTLPHYFKEHDTYVPSGVIGYENDGFLERYLEALCLELDSEFSPYVDNLGYLYDALGLSNLPNSDYNKFLIHISDMLGNPPDIGTDDQYARLLRYLTHILRVKGTRMSLDLYLALFGYKVSSMEIIPYNNIIYDATPQPFKYDNSLHYDTNLIYFFDINLVITDYDGLTTGDPGLTWLGYLKEALGNFIMPIMTNIISITYV